MHFLCVPQMRYAEGDYIFRQGAAGDTFYIISKGQVEFPRMGKMALSKKYITGARCHDGANSLTSSLIITLFISSLSF